jgi:hypothetical protein
VNIVRDYASKSTGKEMNSLRLDTGKSSLDIGFHGYINLATAVERSSAIYTRILFDGLTVGTFDAEIKSYFADEF